jgi:lipoprotein signal peptidase
LWFLAILVAAGSALEWGTQWVIRQSMPLRATFVIADHWLYLQHLERHRTIGLLPTSLSQLTAQYDVLLSLALGVGLIAVYVSLPRSVLWLQVGIGLTLVGMVSGGIELLVRRSSTDYLGFPIAVTNLADLSLFLGIALCLRLSVLALLDPQRLPWDRFRVPRTKL